MTTIGPGLFWALFGYFVFNAVMGCIFTAAQYETRTRTYVISIVIGTVFMVWLGVARW